MIRGRFSIEPMWVLYPRCRQRTRSPARRWFAVDLMRRGILRDPSYRSHTEQALIAATEKSVGPSVKPAGRYKRCNAMPPVADTGKPVRAEVHYFALPDNPNVHDAPGFLGSRPPAVFSAEDGSFTLIGLPGRGVVAAKAVGAAQGRYLTAAGAEAIKGAEREYLFFSYPDRIIALQWNTLVEVSPKEGVCPSSGPPPGRSCLDKTAPCRMGIVRT